MDLVLGILMKIVVPRFPYNIVRAMFIRPRPNIEVAHLFLSDSVIEISLPAKIAISIEHWITSIGSILG